MTHTLPKTDLDHFAEAYIQCALWSSHDTTDAGEEIRFDDYSSDDIAPETLAAMVADCARFLLEYGHIATQEAFDNAPYPSRDRERIGNTARNFWLTRNGHGSNFRDGDWSEPAATALADASDQFGEYDLYLGDDGRIYGMKG